MFVACSPLRGILPASLLHDQAITQLSSHNLEHPQAVRRIVSRHDQPIGRIVTDWSLPGAVLGVDIAVLPDQRTSGAGLAMMRAWIDAADRQHRRCRLSVLRDNPAARLYTRLGFKPVDDDGCSAFLEMVREADCRTS